MDPESIVRSVAEVIKNVRRRGDAALLEYTERWDGARLQRAGLRVPDEVVLETPVDSSFARAFRAAAARIQRFHERVKPQSSYFEDPEGAVLGLRWTPIASVGLYVPGGKAAYPSTLAMTAIPARIAGVERIVVVSPPGPTGEISPQVLMAVRILGIREVYRVGGAQAVAALALGTETVPRVDKIFGPGNAFVAEAKKQLFGEVGIDMVAGPSEVVVYADESAELEWVAADLLAQAEHDESTRVYLICTSETVRDGVRRYVADLVERAPRRQIIEASLGASGSFEVVREVEDAVRRINEIAPEHLSIQVADPWRVLAGVRNAGAIFLGKESPVAVGDYYAGPNHVLPTGSTARFASCLSVEDFMKRSNLAQLSLDFVRRVGGHVEELATGEDLHAHAASVELRRTAGDKIRPRRGVRSVTPYALVEEEAEVKLNQNESPWDIPEDVKDEVARRLRGLPWNRYHQRLPEELAARMGESAGLGASNVIVASGSNLLLQWVFEAYGGTGRTALVPRPSFALYPLWAGVTETRLETVPLNDDLSYAPEAWLEAIRRVRPRLSTLCLPNNPTGSEMEPEAVRELARAAGEVGGLLVVDEAYREFSASRYDRTELVRDEENVVLVRTCSKAFSAAGMRLGYLFAPLDVARDLRKLVPPFHLNLFAAVLGQVLWERRGDFAARVAELVSERERVRAELEKLSGVVAVPSEANFFILRVTDAEGLFRGLRERNILVRRPSADPLLEDSLRVNIGTPEENDRFLAAVREVLVAREGA